MNNDEHRDASQPTKNFLAGRRKGSWAGVISKLTFTTTLLIIAALFFNLVGSVKARPLFATAPSLGTATSFAVLAGSTAINTGPTIVTGDLGVSPGSAVTGFPPGIVVGGAIHAADAVAAQAQSDLTAAYNNLAGQACNTTLTGQDLGGLTLTPGVYCFSSSAQLTGQLTLDAQGDPNAVFIFQIGSTLTTASNSSVRVINGGACNNVFFQVGSSATLGTGTTFVGNILALTGITLTTGATVAGRILARNGAVTLDSNTVSTSCAAAPTSTPTATATATDTPVPPTNTSTATSTGTPAPPTSTSTATATQTPTATGTPTPTGAATQTSTSTGTSTAIATPTPTTTGTPPTSTPTPLDDTTNQLETPSGLDPVGEPSRAQASILYLPLVVR